MSGYVLWLTQNSPICLVFLQGRCSGLVLDMSCTCCQVSRSSRGLLDWASKTNRAVTYSTNPILNASFALLYGMTTFFFIISIVEDPGYIPKLGSRHQQRAIISELFEQWRFDEENFCVACMIRKPLRSKHCRRCGRCVAKHDQ